jgi:CRP/FNR family transcriptional regulator, polysaccharide utilization system transcription regulator
MVLKYLFRDKFYIYPLFKEHKRSKEAVLVFTTEKTIGKQDVFDSKCLFCKDDCCVSCFGRDGGSLFRSLSKSELELLVGSKYNVRFKRGETILKQNTISSNILCLRKGIAKIYVEGTNDKNLILKVLKDTGIITSGILNNDSVRPFTVAAVTDVECCFINSEKVLELFTSNNKFALSLIEHYHQMHHHMFNTLVNLTQKYMPGRVADTILYLSNGVFQQNPFLVPFSRQELAEMSAMTKESFVRILTEFKSSGLIKLDGKYLEVLDEYALMAISKNG